MVLTDVTDAYAVTRRKDYVWMMAEDDDGKYRVFLGDFEADGNNTAHMQMQKYLPSPEIFQVLCALCLLRPQVVAWEKLDLRS